MLFAVYKSIKKADTYVYVAKRDDFSKLPEALVKMLGRLEFVMLIKAADKKTIAGKPAADFIEKFNEQGFYLQLPPGDQDMLAAHRQSLGLSSTPDVKF